MTAARAELHTIKGKLMSAGQEFAVSAVAAGLSHVIHHPLYTLKSQMMYYGPEFRIGTFLTNVKEQKSFLYRGEIAVGVRSMYYYRQQSVLYGLVHSGNLYITYRCVV